MFYSSDGNGSKTMVYRRPNGIYLGSTVKDSAGLSVGCRAPPARG